MSQAIDHTGGRHFGGTMTRILVDYLRDTAPPGSLEQVLREAREARSATVLAGDATWSSYEQLRALLESAARVLGGPDALSRVAAFAPLVGGSVGDYTDLLQALGSVSALYASVGQMAKSLSNIVEIEAAELGPDHCLVQQHLAPGYEPFPEYCAWSIGMLAIPPRLFGFPPAVVVEEECQCRGDPACVFRVRWDAVEESTRRAAYFETRAGLLQMRLDALQHTVAEVVAAENVGEALLGILHAIALAAQAPIHVLALDPESWPGQRVYSLNANPTQASRLADDLLAGRLAHDPGCVSVEVASPRRRYGRLAAIDPSGRGFIAPTASVLEAYGRLAAAALDSAAAREEAQREAATARALLELSSSLADVVGTDELAVRLARVVPTVVHCDRSVVVLFDDDGTGRVVAAHGYPYEVESRLRVAVFDEELVAFMASGFQLRRVEATAQDDYLGALMGDSGSTAAASIPIVAGGEPIGCVVAAVVDRAELLIGDPELPQRLHGLAAQAATAFRNARLIDEIRYQALHDALTGLPNRFLVLDRVDQMLARARRQHVRTAAFFIDLDGFKDINDTLGHEAGDELLRAVAIRLASGVREGDTIGRLGGDEFLVLVEGQGLDDGPGAVARRLLEMLREPFRLEGHGHIPIQVTASIGIAVGDRPSPVELLRDADVALYRAKGSGKDCFVLFHPDMQLEVQDRIELGSALRGACEAGQMHLVYQPIFDLRNRAVTGVEALLRWHHPTRGVIQPDTFVPILEDTGLIVDVGRWVLERACRQAADLAAKGYRLSMSVNVSPRQLELDRFVEDVRGALDRSGLDPASLMLEIVETGVMRNPEATLERLHALKALGIRIAIDDFGTGYSSLAYLRMFPVDALKIDRSFVAGISDSSESDALIHTLVQLGKTMGLETLAEGIEADDQYRQLQDEDCDSGQGFLVARPLPADALERFLRSSPSFAYRSSLVAALEAS